MYARLQINMKTDTSNINLNLGCAAIPESELPDVSHRRSVLQLLLGMTAAVGVFFSLLNWNEHQELALLEMLLACYSIALFPFSRHNKNQFMLSLAFLLPLYSLFICSIALHKTPDSVFVWIIAIPVLSHFLLGRWMGLLISIAYMSAAFIIYLAKSFSEQEGLYISGVSNLALAGLAVLFFSHVYEVSRIRAHRRLLHLATTDNLTSLANRARFLDVFERERNHAARNNADLTLLILDLDHFKLVNDRFGHDIGDEVLKYVSATISHRLRKTDLACRIGGEEFAILLPGANLDRGIAIAETIRKNVADLPYTKEEKVIHLSVSIGAAEYGFDGTDLETLYAVADQHLYKAKASGRNQVRNRTVMRNCELDLA